MEQKKTVLWYFKSKWYFTGYKANGIESRHWPTLIIGNWLKNRTFLKFTGGMGTKKNDPNDNLSIWNWSFWNY